MFANARIRKAHTHEYTIIHNNKHTHAIHKARECAQMLCIVETNTANVCKREINIKHEREYYTYNQYIKWQRIKRVRVCEYPKSNIYHCVTCLEKKFITAWAPSVFGAVWFCRWVVTHSLCGFQLPWPPSCCLHHTEHPFAFIGRLEQIWLSPAYLENVRLNPSSPVLLTRNGPLRIFDTIYENSQ